LGGSLRYALLASAAIGLVVASNGLASAAGCAHPDSVAIMRALRPENSIGKALDILKKRKANFMILYKTDAGAAERATTTEKLSSLKYYSLKVSVLSRFPGGFIVSYDEHLSLAFDSHGVLTGSSCKKIGTGP
jgi:hypothetical protein